MRQIVDLALNNIRRLWNKLQIANKSNALDRNRWCLHVISFASCVGQTLYAPFRCFFAYSVAKTKFDESELKLKNVKQIGETVYSNKLIFF